MQTVADAAAELTGAEFAAFFYNTIEDRPELYALSAAAAPGSGVEKPDGSAKFPIPADAAILQQTFRGHGPVRLDDIFCDPRYAPSPGDQARRPRPSAGAQLSCDPGGLALGRGFGRALFRPLAARRLYRAGRADRDRDCRARRDRDRQCAALRSEPARARRPAQRRARAARDQRDARRTGRAKRSPGGGRSRRPCARRRKWRRSASSPAASRTTSTIC